MIKTADITARIPPHSLEHEMCTLGSMLLDREMIGQVIELLGPDDFYRSDHRAIFKTVADLYNTNKPVDLVTVPEELRRRGQLEEVGGVKYLADLLECVPSAANAVHYATVVQERALLRAMITACDGTIKESYEASEEVSDILERAEKRVFEVAERKVRGDVTHLGRVLMDTFKQIEAQAGKPITGVPTGFFELDDLTSGFQKSELIIIAARPSMGKSAFIFNMAEYMALTERLPVAVFSMEMSKQQVAQRMLCSHAQIDAHKLRMGMLERSDYARMSVAVGQLAEAPIYIDDSTGVTLFEMRAKARRLKARYDIKAVFIDYLQLMEAPEVKKEGRTQEISFISRGLKSLARELECPVICLSQLNRGPEGREEHRPRMSDLRESGAIEQDADVILLLHRPDYYDHKALPVAEVIIAKQRNGPVGTINLTWDSKMTRFRNYSNAEVPESFQNRPAAPVAAGAVAAGSANGSEEAEAAEPAPF
jgi:replicative DNA helicase